VSLAALKPPCGLQPIADLVHQRKWCVVSSLPLSNYKEPSRTMKKLLANFYIARASSALSQRRYSKSLALLRRVFRMFGSPEPNEAAPVLANVLFAQASHEAAEDEAAYYACEVALRQCSAAEKRPRPKREDVNYIRFRCKWILSRLSQYQDSLAMKLACSVPVSASKLAFERVSPFLRWQFPTDLDAASQVDAFLAQNCESESVG
jgi:hypothetical protein